MRSPWQSCTWPIYARNWSPFMRQFTETHITDVSNKTQESKITNPLKFVKCGKQLSIQYQPHGQSSTSWGVLQVLKPSLRHRKCTNHHIRCELWPTQIIQTELTVHDSRAEEGRQPLPNNKPRCSRTNWYTNGALSHPGRFIPRNEVPSTYMGPNSLCGCPFKKK